MEVNSSASTRLLRWRGLGHGLIVKGGRSKEAVRHIPATLPSGTRLLWPDRREFEPRLVARECVPVGVNSYACTQHIHGTLLGGTKRRARTRGETQGATAVTEKR